MLRSSTNDLRNGGGNAFRVTELTAVQEQDTQDIYAVIEDTQDRQTQIYQSVETLFDVSSEIYDITFCSDGSAGSDFTVMAEFQRQLRPAKGPAQPDAPGRGLFVPGMRFDSLSFRNVVARRPVQVARECTYPGIPKMPTLNFKGTEGVVGLICTCKENALHGGIPTLRPTPEAALAMHEGH
ncbi:hypothetical protein Tco_0457907 [Tanacetum coccineum]|uniref:Uncharacterized protein n=1 Tax=Tanacetum coccineum TaxID=301880 RepID=A0ABQ4YWX0_9ASTR